MRYRRLLSPLLTTAILLAAPPAVSSAAGNEGTPAPKSIVTYGDSYTANPDQFIGIVNRIAALSPLTANYPRTGQLDSGKECLQAPDNWPRLLTGMNLDVHDWSCTAQSSATMLDRITASAETGDLNRDTDAVIFPIGINNFGPWGAHDGLDIADFNAVQQAYLSDMHEAAGRVRAIAPRAKLFVVGVPQITNGDLYCAINVVPGHPGAVFVPTLSRVENSLHWMQQQAANDIGAQFVDLKSASQGHDSCAPDTQRYVAGIIDTTTAGYNMIAHPSQAGQRFIAEQVASAIDQA